MSGALACGGRALELGQASPSRQTRSARVGHRGDGLRLQARPAAASLCRAERRHHGLWHHGRVDAVARSRWQAARGCRVAEAIYLPECDAVLLGARPAASPDDKPRWLLYDCTKNAWMAVHLPGADPLGKERFNVSLGLMCDPKRRLIWAMDLLSRPYALRLDLKTADIRTLADAGK